MPQNESFTDKQRQDAWGALYGRFGELPVPAERVWEIEAERALLEAQLKAKGDAGGWIAVGLELREALRDLCYSIRKSEGSKFLQFDHDELMELIPRARSVISKADLLPSPPQDGAKEGE